MMPRARIHRALDEIPAQAWDALHDGRNPFLVHAFLAGMERHGVIDPRLGWTPAHLGLWEGDALVAAAPIIILRPNRSLIEPGYLAWAISSPAAVRHYMLTARSVGMLTVGATELGTLKIQVPSIETQRAVADLVSLMRREAELLKHYVGLKQQFLAVAIEQQIITGKAESQRKADRK